MRIQSFLPWRSRPPVLVVLAVACLVVWAVPPLTHGSHRSQFVDQIRKEPCKANLTREEFIKIVTWIDANVPYYGTYRGKRDLRDKDHPDFRALPLAGKQLAPTSR